MTWGGESGCLKLPKSSTGGRRGKRGDNRCPPLRCQCAAMLHTAPASILTLHIPFIMCRACITRCQVLGLILSAPAGPGVVSGRVLPGGKIETRGTLVVSALAPACCAVALLPLWLGPARASAC